LLSYASCQLDTSEINCTFYGLQRPDAFTRWYDETPEEFVFAVKGPRFITHIRRLREVETPLANFFASGVLRLGEKLGPVLWQFPASFRFSAERLDHFFALLPRDTQAAAALAQGHNEWLADRTWAKTAQHRELRHAIEIRHESFVDPAFVALLRRHRVALVFADSVAWPYAEDLTADFVYLRLHGSEELYASGYSDEALDHFAARIKLWAVGLEPNDARRAAPDAEPAAQIPRDVYAYFDNDAKVRAPVDARSLRARLVLGLPVLRENMYKGSTRTHYKE
jgi:uncharacterized protein YecE (DUF72 family)